MLHLQLDCFRFSLHFPSHLWSCRRNYTTIVYCINRLNSKELIFLLLRFSEWWISWIMNHDIKILTWFAGNPILEISIKILNYVGRTEMRRRILVRVRLIPIYNYPSTLSRSRKILGIQSIYNSKLSNSEVSEPRYIIETSVENIIRLANCDPNYSERGSNVFK